MLERCDWVTIGHCQTISFQNMFAIYDELKIQSFAWIRVVYILYDLYKYREKETNGLQKATKTEHSI